MHTNSINDPKVSTKPGAKTRSRAKKAPAAETLHLKEKHLEVTPVSQDAMQDVTEMIAKAAYYLAEQRRFEPGHDLEDWLVAEQRIRAIQN